MNRRTFSQSLAFGAGLFSAANLRADEQPAPGDGRASAPNDRDKGGPEPNADRPAVCVADFVPRAQARLPQATFDYIAGGTGDEVTLRDNVEAFRRIRLLPPLLHGVNSADLSTTVLGTRVSLPVLLAPVAALRMYHPEGALASVRAASKAGTICVASTSAGHSVEEIAAAANGPKWFQLYVPRDRDIARRLVQRAEKAGYRAIVVTVDLGERKDADLRNRFSMPKEMLLKHLRDVGHTHLTEERTLEELVAFNASAWDLSLSAEFFEWLRGATRLPILLKGVLSKDATLKAVQLGLDGIVVSNHGGRRLDGMPASIDVLRDVAEAAQGKLDVLLDGGVRRGTDVLKAVALGAKAVLIGRPHAWALAADGEAGVTRVLDILRDELSSAMVAAGCRNVAGIERSLIVG